MVRGDVLRQLHAVAVANGHVVARDLSAINGLPIERARSLLWQYYSRGQLRRYARGKYGPLVSPRSPLRVTLRARVLDLLRSSQRPVNSRRAMIALGITRLQATGALNKLKQLGLATSPAVGLYVASQE